MMNDEVVLVEQCLESLTLYDKMNCLKSSTQLICPVIVQELVSFHRTKKIEDGSKARLGHSDIAPRINYPEIVLKEVMN